MSADTKAALDAAIRAHAADELDDALCTGWLMIAAGVTGQQLADDRTSYLTECADSLPLHSALGLATILDQHLTNGLDD